MKTVFDRYYKRYDSWYDKNKFAYLSELEAIKKVLPEKGRGLEIGVGTGRFAAPLGIKYGVDPCARMLEIARARGVDVKLGYGEKLPFRDASFDYAAIIITLCFVKDPVRVLEEARRVLKRRAKIILAIIDKGSFLGRFYQRKKSVFYKQARFFSVKCLSDLLRDTGFGGFSCYQTLFRPLVGLNSIEKPQKGFGKGGFVVITGEKI